MLRTRSIESYGLAACLFWIAGSLPLASAWAVQEIETPAAVADSNQEAADFSQQYQFLTRFVGQWKSKAKTGEFPGQAAVEGTGTMSSQMLGQHWVVSEIKAEMMGAPIEALQTIGFDAAKEKFVGSWIDSTSGFVWRYEGVLDEAGQVLTLEAMGPNFSAPGTTTRFRDSYEFKTPDLILAISTMETAPDQWVVLSKGEIRRREADSNKESPVPPSTGTGK